MNGAGAERRFSSASSHGETVKFPDFEDSTPSDYLVPHPEEGDSLKPIPRHSSPGTRPNLNGNLQNDRWQYKKDHHIAWSNGHVKGPTRGHGRQPSLSEAIRTIRTRKGSVSANAQEIAEALKAPVSIRLIALCIVWYMSSALTNTSSKSILNAFPKPITLTLIQFGFVSGWCLFFAFLASLFPRIKTAIPALRHGIRYPSRDVIATTFPLALFQIGGHLLSSTATEKIPVSLVHTIKGLSPLFTVLAYRFIFRIRYGTATYLSLIPLTLGVVLACSVEFSGNLIGIVCAFGGALIFVTQNIFSKKLFNEAARVEADGTSAQSRKLDKLNLLCYCSGLAFLLTFPMWLWTDGLPMLFLYLQDAPLTPQTISKRSPPRVSVPVEFVFNGIFHFGQNILAFILLSMVSPVTYSVASLIKRVVVITFSIVWFGSHTTPVQAAGIALTFLGLYLYDRTSDASKADRRARLDQLRSETLLPLSTGPPNTSGHTLFQNPQSASSGTVFGNTANGFLHTEDKKSDVVAPGR